MWFHRIAFFFSSRRRHTRWNCDWSSDVCSSDLETRNRAPARSAASAWRPFRTVPAPTMAPRAENDASVASSSMTSSASGTVMVISISRTPASLMARADSRASAADGVRITATSRSSPKMRIRSRRPTCARCATVTCRWYAVRPAVRVSSLDEEDTRWRAVSALQLQRPAHEVVVARLDGTQIEPFDDHHVSPEERVVDGIASLLRTLWLDREVVDAHELDGVRDSPLRGAGIDRAEVACERRARIGPARAVAGLEEQPPGVRRDPRAVEPLGGDMSLTLVLDDATRPDEGVERQRIDRVAALDEVDRRVDVGSGVIAERYQRHVRAVAARGPPPRLDPRSGLARPGDHVGTQRGRDVVDAHPGRIGAMPQLTGAEVERIFREAGAVRDGHFVLASGRHSGRYLEKFQVLQHPRETEKL